MTTGCWFLDIYGLCQQQVNTHRIFIKLSPHGRVDVSIVLLNLMIWFKVVGVVEHDHWLLVSWHCLVVVFSGKRWVLLGEVCPAWLWYEDSSYAWIGGEKKDTHFMKSQEHLCFRFQSHHREAAEQMIILTLDCVGSGLNSGFLSPLKHWLITSLSSTVLDYI